MQYRKYGKTGEDVSVLALGAMRLPLLPGGESWQIDEAQSIALIRHAIDSGINYIDTAYGYHPAQSGKAGMSEPLVGKALAEGYREKTFLASKLPVWLVHSREDMDRLLNEQLDRLHTDHIDFYLAHALHAASWQKVYDLGICEFLDQAKADGRIRHAGFSFHDEYSVFVNILDAYDWEFCQIQ